MEKESRFVRRKYRRNDMEHRQLELYRHRIDEIDARIVALLLERMEVCAEVSDYKQANGLPVLAADREAALLETLAKRAGETHAAAVQSIYRTILSESRAYQNRLRALPQETDR